MNGRSRILAVLVAMAFGFGIGFLARALVKQKPGPIRADLFNSSAHVMRREGGKQTANRSRPDAKDESPLATQLEADLGSLKASDAVTRWLYWFEALEKATSSDFPRLVQLAKDNALTLRLITLRWIEVNPLGLLEYLPEPRSGATDEMAWLFFEEWPRRDPEGAIAALSLPENAGHRHYWGLHIVEAVLEKDVERGLRLISEWNVDGSPRMDTVAKWAAANPRHAAEFTMAHPSGHASDLALETIGHAWGKIDPRAALEFGGAKPADGGYKLAQAALKAWTDKNLLEAAEWLAATDSRTRTRLSPAFVAQWARKDATTALEWTQANLRGSSLREAVGQALKSAAEQDVRATEKLVTEMAPSAIRAEAASALAGKWLPRLETRSRKASPESIAWLSSLDNASVRRVLEKAGWSWASFDPEGLTAFLSSYRGELSPDTYRYAVRYLVSKDPAEAIEWAGQLPANARLAVGAQAFSEWRSAQFNSAMNWFHELPSDDPRRGPFFETAIRDLLDDDRAAEQLAALSPNDQAAARIVISREDLPKERRAVLLNATGRGAASGR